QTRVIAPACSVGYGSQLRGERAMNQTIHLWLRRLWLRRLLGFSVAVALAVPLSATASNAVAVAHPVENAAVISDWNATAMTTLAGDKTRAPQEWALYLAFMHAAMYDAVVGVEGRYRPYVFHDHAPAGASATA